VRIEAVSSPIISVEGLGKEYVIGGQERGSDTFREMLTSSLSAPFKRFRQFRGSPASEEERFWALKDVSFDVQEGEVVGIIGRNGAGKSTLLKILSRIAEPTEGRITVRGRIASLLEVGTGFHPELTGRENIYLNGAILGMSRAEIQRKFDEIVAFAEIEKFLDTPVKRYSSGMYVRLAFAVAAHLDPEILVVDEVLAVGDAEFQKKCLGKMQDVAGHGRTVIFVSHNMAAVRRLCSKGILLKSGRLTASGAVDDVIAEYTADYASPKGSVGITNATRRGSGELIIERISLTDGQKSLQSIPIFGKLRIILRVGVRQAVVPAAAAWILVRNMGGDEVAMIMQKDFCRFQLFRQGEEISCDIEAGFRPGRYVLAVGLLGVKGEIIDWVDDAISFEVEPGFVNNAAFDHRLGLITIKGNWVSELNAESAEC
jgi:lipopolysaccharide transport system ATP-binding protein